MPNNSTTPASALRRQRLLAVLVRAPEDGYCAKAVARHLYPLKGRSGSVHAMQRDLDYLTYTVWHDFGRVGMLKIERYLSLPLEVVLNGI